MIKYAILDGDDCILQQYNCMDECVVYVFDDFGSAISELRNLRDSGMCGIRIVRMEIQKITKTYELIEKLEDKGIYIKYTDGEVDNMVYFDKAEHFNKFCKVLEEAGYVKI